MTCQKSISQIRMRIIAKIVLSVTVLTSVILIWNHLTGSSPGDIVEPVQVDPDSRIGISADRDAEIARKALGLVDYNHESGPALLVQIKDLLKIKQSVQVELMALEKKRKELQSQISAFHRTIEELQIEANSVKGKLEVLKLSLKQAELAEYEYNKRNTPEIFPPLSLKATFKQNYILNPPSHEESNLCTMDECFDYSRCSISSEFPVFVYDFEKKKQYFDKTFESTRIPNNACVFVVIIESSDQLSDLSSLSHWNGDGRNHILVSIGQVEASNPSEFDHSRALIAASSFTRKKFRPDFDISIPILKFLSSKESWQHIEQILPLRRRFLLSFEGFKTNLTNLDNLALKSILAINKDRTNDKVLINVNCESASKSNLGWNLCQNEEKRKSTLKSSTFSLIFLENSLEFQNRVYESLQMGAIPVVLGPRNGLALMPLAEVIDWRKAAIMLPFARSPDLHFILRSLKDSDLFSMKRQGNLIWTNYFSTSEKVFKSILQILRERINLPSIPFQNMASPSVFGNTSQPILEQLPPESEPNESLGPLEQPKASGEFKRNFSSTTLDSYSRWNVVFQPFHLPPYSPWDTMLPTDAKFLGSNSGFRPIGEGTGGSGKEFSQAIGGNFPSEQFTVVILTYEREEVLVEAIKRLYGLPFLNKVVVVWNTELPPSPELKWPDIGVPVVVIRSRKNSLNNRFLPYDVIETEAILSMDDDAHLKHDEIIFGFRVWRENRDRLVGFPGRFHAWDLEHNSWNYNSNHSCELSMVLTGASFYHKYYNYIYSYTMPQAIRDIVDEYMNCEDLAMNFLISHIIRKPPIKVTSRWTFRCPGCPVVLSEDASHFQERHKCINFFSQVYGYMPLLYTQFRADSVLFKTRIPADKQKCFKYI